MTTHMSAQRSMAFRGRVEGRVQGVAYRASMRHQARHCAVGGWVRNLPDGSVEFFVQGEAEGVRRLLDWAGKGPPGASVDGINVVEAEPEPGQDSFEVRG